MSLELLRAEKTSMRKVERVTYTERVRERERERSVRGDL